MANEEQIMIMLPKSEWMEVKSNIKKLLDQQKGSPLDGYVSKNQVMELYNFSDRTWSRLKSKGLIQVRKLGGLQFVKADDFIAAIESGSIT